MFIAWIYGNVSDSRTPVSITGRTLIVVDGDSFVIGSQKLRMDGIDAPEYLQTCSDAAGKPWNCGHKARASLEQMLREPGLACVADAQDRYSRSIVTCSNNRLSDIAAAQVTQGHAVSDDYFGIRSYGDEEDAARLARLGIWTGEFMLSSEWRASHPTLRTNTVPAE